MKNVVLITLFLFASTTFFGQTLVRIGKQNVSKKEFLTAFRKNNVHIKPTEKAYRDYLNLYIRYKLKVRAAMDLGLDTLAGQINELQNFRSQIVDQYTNDEASLNEMTREAFLRSQHDIRVSYIYVSVSKNALPADTAKAWKKIQDALHDIKNNKDFGETAAVYSEDPFAKSNKGDIGFITVFDLPYEMETLAYQIPKGNISPVLRTGGGYIILKKTAERPAEGRIHIAQILLIYPFQANDAAKEDTRQRADSIYKSIQNGSDFGELAKKFSGDNLSYQMGGVLPEFGIGKYEAGFENTAFDLKKDGDVSTPYVSSFGYHIIKRLSRKSVPAIADKKTLDEIKEKVKADPRIAYSRKHMLQTILKRTAFTEYIPVGNKFWDYTDSVMKNKKPALNAGMNDQSLLFTMSDKKYTVGDWIVYRKSLKTVPSMTNGKTNADILDTYKQTIAFAYYRDHLEKYNAIFADQVNEFRDGNLLFEIMQRKVWSTASADSVGLRKYYESHKAQYAGTPASPKNFDDVRGEVVNDYQNELENQWIAELKKKYPVVINEAVLKTLPK